MLVLLRVQTVSAFLRLSFWSCVFEWLTERTKKWLNQVNLLPRCVILGEHVTSRLKVECAVEFQRDWVDVN